MSNKRKAAILTGVLLVSFLVLGQSWPVSDNDLQGTYQLYVADFSSDYIHLQANNKYIHKESNQTKVGKWKVQKGFSEITVILEGDPLNVNGNEYHVRRWFGRITKLHPYA